MTETRHLEREGRSRIEVWRNSPEDLWAVTVLPDEREDGHPGRTYTRADSLDLLPGDVPDDPDALLEWARLKVQAAD